MKYFTKADLGKKNNILYILFFAVFVIVSGFLSFISLIVFYAGDRQGSGNWVTGQENRFETDIANTFFGQFEYVNLNGLMARALGMQELNDVVKLENGYLTVPSPYFQDEIIESNADMIRAFDVYLEQNEIPMIFVITPNTNAKYDPKMPSYFTDYGNGNLDRIADALRNRGVFVIDLRDELERDGINAYDMMYKTDHHWTTGMGFYAYTKIADILEEELGCTIDPSVKNIENYTVKTYKKWHLGSRGQRTGKYYAGIDDFDLITPNFPTHVCAADGTKEGSYEEILIDASWFKDRDLTLGRYDNARRSIYDWVLERSQGDYINDLSSNDCRILMLSDSFGKAVCPFVDISFAQTKWYYGPVGRSAIEDYSPDAVVMLYDLSDAFSPEDFDYGWAQE